MQFSLETGEGLKRRITITVPAADFESQVAKRLQQISKRVRLDGFRPGKIPLKVIKRRYGSDARNEMLGEVIQKSFVDALSESNINPAGAPTLESTVNEEGKDLEFVASFEVYPAISLGDFSDVNVEMPEAEVMEKDVDAMIDMLRDQQKSWVPVEDEGAVAATGDQVTIDCKGVMDGEEFEGGSFQDEKLELGSNRMIAGFEDGLIGASAGETRTVNLTFPEDYYEKLAGKPVEFTVTVKQIAKSERPEVDDEFMAKFGIKDGGLEKFRQEIKQNMERELKRIIHNKVKDQVLEGLLDIHEFDTPDALIKQEADQMRDHFIQRMQREYGAEGKIDNSKISSEPFRKEALKRVKLGLIVAEIVSSNNMEPSAESIRELIEEIASPYQDPDSVIDWYYNNSQQLDKVKYSVLENQVIDTILESAKITKKTFSYDEVMKSSEASGTEESTAEGVTEENVDNDSMQQDEAESSEQGATDKE